MKKLKYLVWVVILLVLSSYNIEAKVSNKNSEKLEEVKEIFMSLEKTDNEIEKYI